MFIDTHAHLNELKNDLSEILQRAADAGVEKIIIPATTYESSVEIMELVQKYDILYGAVGIHPTELKNFDEKQFSEIESLAGEKKIVAIGEIGLDYYREQYDKELQQDVLISQLRIAKRLNMPVILHNRNSSDDLMRIIVDEYDNGTLKGQFHSFSGDKIMASKYVEMEFYISFTGNITYKPKEHTLIAYEIVKETPLDNLLLETDTPYLPPVPYRGKRNEPSFIQHTAGKLAEIKGISIEELAAQTTKNAEKLFNI